MNSACFCVFLLYTPERFLHVSLVYTKTSGFCGFRIYTNRAPHHPNISEVDREGRAGESRGGLGVGAVGGVVCVGGGWSEQGGRSVLGGSGQSSTRWRWNGAGLWKKSWTTVPTIRVPSTAPNISQTWGVVREQTSSHSNNSSKHAEQ